VSHRSESESEVGGSALEATSNSKSASFSTTFCCVCVVIERFDPVDAAKAWNIGTNKIHIHLLPTSALLSFSPDFLSRPVVSQPSLDTLCHFRKTRFDLTSTTRCVACADPPAAGIRLKSPSPLQAPINFWCH